MRLTIAVLVALSTLLAFRPVGSSQGKTDTAPVAPCDLDATAGAAASQDGLLGGSQVSFAERYGEPSNTLIPEYSVGEDCGVVPIFMYEGTIVTDIGVFSPKEYTEDDQDRSEPHDADWSLDEAMAIAGSFLPPDIVTNPPVGNMNPPGPLEIGEPIVVTEVSETLCQQVPAAAYEHVDETPVCGGFSYTMHRTTSGDVTWIDIELRVEDRAA